MNVYACELTFLPFLNLSQKAISDLRSRIHAVSMIE